MNSWSSGLVLSVRGGSKFEPKKKLNFFFYFEEKTSQKI